MLNGKHRQPGPVPGPLCGSYAHVLPVLDDLTDARLVADARAHLADCAWCRAQRATYNRFDEALRLHFTPDAMPFLPINARELAMPEIHDPVATAVSPDEADEAADDDALRLTVSPLPIPPRPPRRSWRLATGAASLAAVLVISLLAGLIFTSHGRPQSASNRHATATPAIAPGSQVSLSAIGMSSEADGWAMGQVMGQNGGSSDDPGYVLHYTGGQWVQVRNTPLKADVTAIKMLSPTDGWAIGNHVYHYDGVAWHEIHVPVSDGFDAISAVSTSNIWIAGGPTPVTPPDGRAVVLHYDGHGWFQQPTPSVLDFFSITSLSMISPNEGWAVGSATRDGDTSYSPTGVILHYINGTWQLAKKAPNVTLQTISMGSATDGWVGGNLITFAKPAPYPTNNPVTEVDRPMLLHYTGGQWIEVNAPRSALTPAGVESQGQIGSITMFSATEGWMFAGLDSGRQALEPSTLLGPDVFRLEQGHWVQVETPTIQQRRFANMGQVVSLSPNEFWGVGSSFWWTGIPSDTGSGYAPTVTPLIVHYKDGVWSVIES